MGCEDEEIPHARECGGHARCTTFTSDLVEERTPGDFLASNLVPRHRQHGCRLLPAAYTVAVAQAGEYVVRVTGSTIHNFRSYLSIDSTTCFRIAPPTARRARRSPALGACGLDCGGLPPVVDTVYLCIG